jgi:hypothetical protein
MIAVQLDFLGRKSGIFDNHFPEFSAVGFVK